MFEGSCSVPAPAAHRRRASRRGVSVHAPTQAFFAALEAAVAEADGELLVRGAGREGAVFVVDGQIAWVLAGGDGERLGRALARHAGVDRQMLRDALARGLRSGRSLVECLLDDGDVSLRAVERALLEHHAAALAELACARADELSFHPGRRAHGSALLFSASAVVAAILHARDAEGDVAIQLTPSTEASEPVDVDAVLVRMMALEGAIGAAVVDLRSGTVLGWAGGNAALDVETAARGGAELVRAELDVVASGGLEGGVEEVLLTLGSQHHLVRVLEGTPSLFLYLITEKAAGRLGLARYGLRRLEAGLAA